MRYYYVLGVSPDASYEEINFAYKTLSEKYLSVDFQINREFAENKLNELNEAYSVLSDVNQRNLYNLNNYYSKNIDINNNGDSINYSLNSINYKSKNKSKLILLTISIAIILFSLLFMLSLLFKNIKNNINTFNSSFSLSSSFSSSKINSSDSPISSLSSSTPSVTNSKSTSKVPTKSQSQAASLPATSKNYGSPAPNGTIPDDALYCYNLLNSNQKAVYKEVLYSINNFISKTDDLSKWKIPFNEAENLKIIYYVLNDNPQIFWINLSKGFSRESDSSGNYLNKYYFTKNYSYDNAQVLNMKTNLDNNIDQVKSMLTSSMSEYQKTKIIHDWVVKKTVYETNAPNAHNIYGAIVDGRAVCEGYAKAMQFILYNVGIQCLFITGVGTTDNQTENHAWNIVKIQGNWYQLDATWDDPADKQSLTDFYYYYFLITDSEIKRNHTISNEYYTPPVCNANEFNYFNVEKLLFSTYDTSFKDRLITALAETFNTKSLFFSFKFTNEAEYIKAKVALFSPNNEIINIYTKASELSSNKLKNVNSYSYSNSEILYTIRLNLEYQ